MDGGTDSRPRMMGMDDAALLQCNESELLEIVRRAKLGHLRRGLPLEVLVQIATGEIEIRDEHRSGTIETRAILEKFIQDHIEQTRSQLPGCDGHCTTYPCSEGRHALCFGANKDTLR
jgi:hypothetical protein